MDFPEFTLDTAALDDASPMDPDTRYDCIIVGGGPAAMSAAIYGARKMMNLALMTRDLGGQMLETSDIENWLGFQSINAGDLAGMFAEHVKSFDIPLALNRTIREITADGEGFAVRTDDGTIYRGRTVIFSTGKRHRPLGVPGEKELVGKGVAYCATCDAPFFSGKRVIVAGGGNSAFTTATDLIKAGATVCMVNYVRGWQADETLQERLRASGGVRFLEYHRIVRIEGAERVAAVVVQGRDDGAEERLEAEGIFVEIGLLPNIDAVRNLVELTDGGEIIVDCSCRTSVEGFFAAGDVTTVPHKQVVIAAGEGAKAALSAYDYLINRGLI